MTKIISKIRSIFERDTFAHDIANKVTPLWSTDRTEKQKSILRGVEEMIKKEMLRPRSLKVSWLSACLSLLFVLLLGVLLGHNLKVPRQVIAIVGVIGIIGGWIIGIITESFVKEKPNAFKKM